MTDYLAGVAQVPSFWIGTGWCSLDTGLEEMGQEGAMPLGIHKLKIEALHMADQTSHPYTVCVTQTCASHPTVLIPTKSCDMLADWHVLNYCPSASHHQEYEEKGTI